MNYIVSTLGLFTTIIFSFIFSSCSGQKESESNSIKPIKYQIVEYKNTHYSRSFNGIAQTEQIIGLSFRSSGIITELNLRLGQKVHKGQLLAKLDNVQARLSYEQAMTQVNSSESKMNTAKLHLNRIRSMYEKGSASLSEFETVKDGYKTAQQAYQSAKRGLDIQAEQIKYGYIYAPVSGTIASISAEAEENVSAGQVIAILNAGTTMEVVTGVPENAINDIHENMSAIIRFSSIEGRKFNGVVREIAPSTDINTGTYPLKIDITDPNEMIKSGMAAEVTFLLEQSDSQGNLIVPSNVVGEDGTGNFVFLLSPTNGDTAIVHKQYVTLGNLTVNGFEIKDGLNPEDKIATAGLQSILNEQKVILIK